MIQEVLKQYHKDTIILLSKAVLSEASCSLFSLKVSSFRQGAL